MNAREAEKVPWLPRAEGPARRPDLNAWMRPLSMALSGAALLLMLVGFAGFVAGYQGAPQLPGETALPLRSLLGGGWHCPSLALMSLGMVLLGLLPVLRVALALVFYLREKSLGDVLAAAGVLAVLVLSMFLE